jgi:putative transcriptional regulator
MNDRLAEFRRSQDLNQDEMAKIVGVSKSYYAKIELGQRNPSYNFIQKFKSKFDTNVDSIFFKPDIHEECKSEVV